MKDSDLPYILQQWKYAREAKENLFEQIAVSNYGYYDGSGHWSETERQTLEKEKRPVTVMNYVFKAVNTLVGNEIQNRNEIHVFPVENGDVRDANILNYGYKYVKYLNKLDWRFTQANMDGFITSQGWLKNYVKRNREGDFEIFIRNKNPLLIDFDPDSVELDLEDCKHIHERMRMPKDQAKLLWPKFAKDIDNLAGMRSIQKEGLFYDKEKDLVTVIYSEYKQYEKVSIYEVIDPETEKVEYTRVKPQDESLIQSEDKDTFEFVYGTTHLADVVLDEPVLNPYKCGEDKYSYSLFCPYFTQGKGVGIVDQIKSIQDVINKSYSQGLDILNRQAKAGGLYEKGAVDDHTQLEEMSTTGTWAEVRDLNKVRPNDPVQYPSAHMNMVKDGIELSNQILNLQDVFFGDAPGRVESGLGIQILRRQAGISFEMPADNLRLAQVEVGRKILNQFRSVWAGSKFMRIAGEDGLTKEVNITPGQVSVRDIDQRGEQVGELKKFENKLREGKYDFVVDVNAPSLTQRMFNQGIALQIFQTLPAPQLVPLLIDMLDFPRKEEWKAALQQAQPEQRQQMAGDMMNQLMNMGGLDGQKVPV